MTWNGLQTHDTIYTHFQGITSNIYGFGRPFLLLNLCTRPLIYIYIYLPIHNGFYPSKWQMCRSLHKAIMRTHPQAAACVGADCCSSLRMTPADSRRRPVTCHRWVGACDTPAVVASALSTHTLLPTGTHTHYDNRCFSLHWHTNWQK